MRSETNTYCKCGLQQQLWFDRSEVAARLGVAVQTLAGWAVQGIGPKHVVIGKFARYHIEDLEDWEKQLRDGGESAGPAAPHRGHRRIGSPRAPASGGTAA